MKKIGLLLLALVTGFSLAAGYDEYIFNRISSNVVRVYNEQLTGGGTGFFVKIANKLYVITNEHVCSGAGSATGGVRLEQRGTYARGTILKKSNYADLCVIEPTYTFEAKGLKLASSITMNERVTAYGHPLLRPVSDSVGRAIGVDSRDVIIKYRESYKQICPENSRPIITAMFGFIPVPACLRTYVVVETTAEVYPGNSGSPVVNKWGNVVGVIFLTNFMTFRGDMVPLNELAQFIKEFEAELPQQSQPTTLYQSPILGR